MRTLSVVVLLAFAAFASATVHFSEEFDASWESRWVDSTLNGADQGKWVHTAGDYYGDADADKGIQTSEDYRRYGISAAFPSSFSNKGKDLVLQFTTKNTQNLDCGGSYVKLLPSGFDQDKFGGDTDYLIMAGPDVCGSTRRIHFIFNYKGNNLEWKKTIAPPSDHLTHVFTFVVHPDNTYEMLIDGESKAEGKLEEDWDFLAPKEIPDPEDTKPADWVDAKKIADPAAAKPEDWDNEPKMIPDADAVKPEDWDDEEDGEWVPPLVANPEYKGEWKPTMIDNPEYKGPWVQKTMANPDYAPDDELYLYEDIAAAGIEIWQVKAGTIFDNIIVTDSVEEAQAFAARTSGATKEAEKAAYDAQEAEKAAEAKAAQEAAEAAKAAAAEEEELDDDDL